jgi:uncharacterized protein (DUF2062 family)
MAPIWGLSAYLGSFVVPQQVAATPSPAMAHWAWDTPQTWPTAFWEQVTPWGPALLVGLPIAGAVRGLTAYALVYSGWAVLIKQERRRCLRRAAGG